MATTETPIISLLNDHYVKLVKQDTKYSGLRFDAMPLHATDQFDITTWSDITLSTPPEKRYHSVKVWCRNERSLRREKKINERWIFRERPGYIGVLTVYDLQVTPMTAPEPHGLVWREFDDNFFDQTAPVVETQGCEDMSRIKTEGWIQFDRRFRLLDLPVEIRELIYLYAIGLIILPRQKWFKVGNAKMAVWTLGNRAQLDPIHGKLWEPPTESVVEPPNTNLLLANKQVNEEAMYVAWTRTIKRFTRPRIDFAHDFRLIDGPTKYPSALTLKSVQLEMTPLWGHKLSQYPRIALWEPTTDLTGVLDLEGLALVHGLKNIDLRFVHASRPDTYDIFFNDEGMCQIKAVDTLFAITCRKLVSLI